MRGGFKAVYGSRVMEFTILGIVVMDLKLLMEHAVVLNLFMEKRIVGFNYSWNRKGGIIKI